MNENNLFCPSCKSKEIIKTGNRYNKYQKVQRYRCNDCNENFITKKIIKKTYPANIILNTISYYNLGHSQQQTSKIISQKHKTIVPQKTISNWINEYKPITPFHKLRKKAIKLYIKDQLIEKHTFLHNNLPYTFQIHKAKLQLLFKDILYNNQFINQSKFYEPIKSYLESIPTNKFPHHIFKEKSSLKIGSDAEVDKVNTHLKNKKQTEQRASQLKFHHLKITHLSKTNLANKLTSLALNMAKTNKDRHQAVQNFMLINDSTTIATEIPIYLTNDDIKYFKKHNFYLNLDDYRTPITGHIDILQIRNGLIHILDYKPEANKTHPIEQLTIYALALASRTKLDLYSFKCAWFDENHYFEFFPLHTVYRK